MQETESFEDMEYLFATALARTYQNDGLIDLYRALREIWQRFRQSIDRSSISDKADAVLHQVEDICLSLEACGHLSRAEREIVAYIKLQCGRLEEKITYD